MGAGLLVFTNQVQRLFALKKGAEIGGMNMSKEQTAKKERFLREVERQLLRKGLDSEMMEDGILNVTVAFS